jgi:hypothetical protein
MLGMTETPLAYSHDHFPYAALLEELSQEAVEESLLPVEAYVRYTDRREARGLSPQFDYLSAPTDDVVAARATAAALGRQGVLASREMVLPVDLGPVGWVPSDRLAFCGLVMAGADLRPVARHIGYAGFEHRLARAERGWGVNLDAVNDTDLSLNTRQWNTDRFVLSLCNTLRATDAVRVPARAFISLTEQGPEPSLDCWAERRMAHHLDIPAHRAATRKDSMLTIVQDA